MNPSRLNPDDDESIQDVAADWLVRRERGFTAAEQDEFLQWLGRDSRHRAWIAYQQKTWGEFDLLAQWRPEHSVDPNPDLLARPRPGRRRKTAGAVFSILALAACVAMAAIWWPRANSKVEHTVAPSNDAAVARGYERRTLSDGSTVELNIGAAIDVRFSARERHVTLLHGEALFTVFPDPTRPFVVRANGVDVRAIGTAFNVRIGSAAVEVLVTEGRVEVARQSANTTPVPSPAPIVAAGHRAVVELASLGGPRITAVSAAEIARELAWQPRLLDFSSTPLAEVVAEFNRCNRTQLVVVDPELATLPIVASLHSDNVEALVRLLASSAGVRAERSGDKILLRRER
jgi:transmembrane sensor